MPNRLSANINSQYFRAANQLTAKHARRKIAVYVESYDDIYFWRTVLGDFEDDTRYFEIMLPSRGRHLERGKKAAISKLLEGVGSDMIACVDADYDYLMQGASPASQQMMENPYIFHTYAYAIENLQCYAPSLHNVCVAAVLNDRMLFDFEAYLATYSEIIFPLFVWNIWFYRSTHYHDFTLTYLNAIIDIGDFRLRNVERGLDNLRKKVGRKAETFRHAFPDAKESYLQVKNDLKALGVTPQTTYLYIQGHHLFDRVVVPMLNSVCHQLYKEREDEIRREAIHNTQYRTEIAAYDGSTGNIADLLKKNTGYRQSEPFKRIQRDIDAYLEGLVSHP